MKYLILIGLISMASLNAKAWCLDDSSCPVGQYCHKRGFQSQCAEGAPPQGSRGSEKECNVDWECNSGEHCVGEAVFQPGKCYTK